MIVTQSSVPNSETPPADRPTPKFRNGEFVYTRSGTLAYVAEMKWVEPRGWIFGVYFAQENMCTPTYFQSCGSGWWEDEKSVRPVTDPVVKLKCRRWEHLIKIKALESELKREKDAALCITNALVDAGLETTPNDAT